MNKAREVEPEIVALSGFLSVSFDSMKETTEALEDAGLRENVKIMVGGGQVNEDVRSYTGADGYEPSAPKATKLAKKWVKE